jgi:LPXTG-motif cell wall-anchored protein
MLPIHQQDGENQPAPLGSGIALLTALGAGYVVAKKRKE